MSSMCMESGVREKRQQTDESDVRKEILYGSEANDVFFPSYLFLWGFLKLFFSFPPQPAQAGGEGCCLFFS